MINGDYDYSCLSKLLKFTSDSVVNMTCKETLTNVTSKSIKRSIARASLIATCGPKKFDTGQVQIFIRRDVNRPPNYLCPDAEGTREHFTYTWYKDKVSSDSRVVRARSLTYDTSRLPLQYYCIVRNRYTKAMSRFRLVILDDPSDGPNSVLWVVIPAVLLIVIVPLLYLSYLKFIGDRDFSSLWKEKLFKDEVDYMVTQIVDESDEFSTKTKKKEDLNIANRILRKALGHVVMDKGSNSAESVPPSVVISLPMTNSKKKIKQSKTYRERRAMLFKSQGISPFFKRPQRKIKKQKIRYAEDTDLAWIGQGMRKVERWQEKDKNEIISMNSFNSLERELEDNSYDIWFMENLQRLNCPFVLCTKDEYIANHRLKTYDVAGYVPKHKLFGHENDIVEMSDRLNEMYRIAKPHKSYFPTVKRIGDPFQPILMDTLHPSHEVTRRMWNEFIDKLFTVSADVGTFNKLSKKILDRTMNTYGNPAKIRKTSERSKLC